MNIKKQLFATIGLLISRMIGLPANFSPMGAAGIFGAPLPFMVSVIIFDAAWGGLYYGFWWTWLGFACYPLLGVVAKRVNLMGRLALVPAASIGFFLLSNFGSFWYWYPHTWDGLTWCYTLALPFFMRTLAGDVFFGYGYLLIRAMAKNRAANTFFIFRPRFF